VFWLVSKDKYTKLNSLEYGKNKNEMFWLRLEKYILKAIL
jgi:hypothetical protein